jgi:hypothetical protein
MTSREACIGCIVSCVLQLQYSSVGYMLQCATACARYACIECYWCSGSNYSQYDTYTLPRTISSNLTHTVAFLLHVSSYVKQLVEDEWERLVTVNEKAKSEQDVAQLQASSATAAKAAQEDRKR